MSTVRRRAGAALVAFVVLLGLLVVSPQPAHANGPIPYYRNSGVMKLKVLDNKGARYIKGQTTVDNYLSMIYVNKGYDVWVQRGYRNGTCFKKTGWHHNPYRTYYVRLWRLHNGGC